MCHLRGYRETMQWEDCFQKPCVWQQQQGRKDVLVWCMACLVFLRGEPRLVWLHLGAGRRVSRKALGCCAHWRAEFEYCISLSLSSGDGTWTGAEYAEVQTGQISLFPTCFLAGSPLPWSCQPEARLAVGSSVESTWPTANLDSIWIMVAFVFLSPHSLTNHLHFVLEAS